MFTTFFVGKLNFCIVTDCLDSDLFPCKQLSKSYLSIFLFIINIERPHGKESMDNTTPWLINIERPHGKESMDNTTPWLIKHGGSMPHSQGISNNPYPAESIQFLVLAPISLRCSLTLSSHICVGLPKDLLPVGLPVNVLKALLPSLWLHALPISIF